MASVFDYPPPSRNLFAGSLGVSAFVSTSHSPSVIARRLLSVTKPYPPGKLWLPPAELRCCGATPVPGVRISRRKSSGVRQRSGREAYPATYSGRERNTPQRNPERPCASALEV